MVLYNKLAAFGLYVTILYGANSFVLLTANVEDLKRIAHKFVSESLADKIARFIVEAAENGYPSEHDTSNETYNEDTNLNLLKVFSKHKIFKGNNTKLMKRDKKAHNNIQIRGGKTKQDGKINKMRQYIAKKDQKKTQHETKEYSLEYFRAGNRSKVNPNLIIDIEKIEDSDESLMMNSRKDFESILSENFKASKPDKVANIDKDALPSKTSILEGNTEEIDDFDYNGIDAKSTGKMNLTTEVQRVEFDQYFNTNYPKAKVVATSGPVELAKDSKGSKPAIDATSSEYD